MIKKIRKWQKGSAASGSLYVIVMLTLITSIGYMLAGGELPGTRAGSTGSQVVIITPIPQKAKSDLQLYTFLGITVTPTPTPSPTPTPQPTSPPISSNPSAPITGGHGCQGNQYNDEPEILIGSDPAPGGVVGANKQVRVWVGDEGAPFIAPNEIVDPTTGKITTPGDRTALDGRGTNYYLWEPAIYITPLTGTNTNGPFTGDAENGGKPYFPALIKGNYSNTPGGKGNGINGASIDSYTGFVNGPTGQVTVDHVDEYIWDVTQLGLAAGSYRAEFVIHDGDDNMAIDCINIQI